MHTEAPSLSQRSWLMSQQTCCHVGKKCLVPLHQLLSKPSEDRFHFPPHRNYVILFVVDRSCDRSGKNRTAWLQLSLSTCLWILNGYTLDCLEISWLQLWYLGSPSGLLA